MYHALLAPLLAALATSASAATTSSQGKPSTITSCRTSYTSVKPKSVSRTTEQARTYTSTHTIVQTTTPVVTQTPAATTLTSITSLSSTTTVTADAATSSVTVTSTQTATLSEVFVQTTTSVSSLDAQTVTVTTTSTVAPPAGFTPSNPGAGSRRRRAAQLIERQPEQQVKRRSNLMDKWLEKRAQMAVSAASRLNRDFYPAEVDCKPKVLKTVRTVKQVAASVTQTVQAPTPTNTFTSTSVLVSTSTSIPPVVTSVSTVFTTTQLTSTRTSFTTVTSTYTPPVVTEAVPAPTPIYAACTGNSNYLQIAGGDFGDTTVEVNYDLSIKSQYDCCASCQSDPTCRASFFSNEVNNNYCETFNGGTCDPNAVITKYYTGNGIILSLNGCGRAVPLY